MLYHGLGSGKTCSAISVTETYRLNMIMGQKFKKIIIIASPNVQENFKLQLFDYTKLHKTNTGWSFKEETCAGQNILNELEDINNSKTSLDTIKDKAKRIIKKYYSFYGYIEFSNKIEKDFIKAKQLYKNNDIAIKNYFNSLYKDKSYCY